MTSSHSAQVQTQRCEVAPSCTPVHELNLCEPEDTDGDTPPSPPHVRFMLTYAIPMTHNNEGLGGQVADLSTRAQLLHQGNPTTVQIKAFSEGGITLEHPRLGLVVLVHDASNVDAAVGPSNIIGTLKKIQHGPGAAAGIGRGSSSGSVNGGHLLLVHCELKHAVFGCSDGMLVVQASSDAVGKFAREAAAEWRKLDSSAAVTGFDSVYNLDSAVQDAVAAAQSAVTKPEFAVGGIGQSSSAAELRDGVANLEQVLTLSRVEDAYSAMASAPSEEVKQFMSDCISNASTKGKVPITIVTGVPGSGKARVCSSIVALAKEDTKWMVLKPDFETAPIFNLKKLQSQLKNVAAAHSRSRGGGGGGGGNSGDGRPPKLTRVLLITSGYTDVAEVVRAILHHPDWKVASKFTIASVCCCVDPANTFWQSRRTFPKFLEQAAAGWCSSIILTGQGRESCEKRPRSARDKSSGSSSSSGKKKKSSGFTFADLLGGGSSSSRPKSAGDGSGDRPSSGSIRPRTAGGNANLADIATSLPEWVIRKANPDARVVRACRDIDDSST